MYGSRILSLLFWLLVFFFALFYRLSAVLIVSVPLFLPVNHPKRRLEALLVKPFKRFLLLLLLTNLKHVVVQHVLSSRKTCGKLVDIRAQLLLVFSSSFSFL